MACAARMCDDITSDLQDNTGTSWLAPATMPSARRIVVKVGSNLLTHGAGDLNVRFMRRLVADLADLHAQGANIVLVSSGAVAAGRTSLPVSAAGGDINRKQMLAAIGQVKLMQVYDRLFGRHHIVIGQALLARTDLRERQGYLNARTTLLGLLEHRVLPIINENDVVAFDEIKFGDNDNLSAVVATLIEADLLVILTDIDGLYTADPRLDPQAVVIREVSQIDASVERLAGGAGSSVGTGGMRTKVQAARLAVRAGVTVVLAHGGQSGVLQRAVRLDPVGTIFRASAVRHTARSLWLASRVASRGVAIVDAGAVRALREHGKSLLPAGVQAVRGRFERGDLIDIRSADDMLLASGLTNYGSVDLERIRGAKSQQIVAILGYQHGDEVVHRNNLVLL